jgi:hypothetical protein
MIGFAVYPSLRASGAGEAGIRPGRVVGRRTAVSRGVGGARGRVRGRCSGPARGVAPVGAHLAGPLPGCGSGRVGGSVPASGLVRASGLAGGGGGGVRAAPGTPPLGAAPAGPRTRTHRAGGAGPVTDDGAERPLWLPRQPGSRPTGSPNRPPRPDAEIAGGGHDPRAYSAIPHRALAWRAVDPSRGVLKGTEQSSGGNDVAATPRGVEGSSKACPEGCGSRRHERGGWPAHASFSSAVTPFAVTGRGLA